MSTRFERQLCLMRHPLPYLFNANSLDHVGDDTPSRAFTRRDR
jgi:hypothetical protein